MKGTPQILSSYTTASDDDALAVVNSRGPVSFIGDLMRRMLQQWEAPTTCIYLPASRRIIGSAEPVTAAAILAAWNADSGLRLIVQPRAGQRGQVLYWELVSDTMGDTALAEMLTNAFQRRTFYGIVNSAVAYAEPAFWVPMILVDQVNGVVGIASPAGEAETLVDALSPSGETVGLRFEAVKTKLIFE